MSRSPNWGRDRVGQAAGLGTHFFGPRSPERFNLGDAETVQALCPSVRALPINARSDAPLPRETIMDVVEVLGSAGPEWFDDLKMIEADTSIRAILGESGHCRHQPLAWRSRLDRRHAAALRRLT